MRLWLLAVAGLPAIAGLTLGSAAMAAADGPDLTIGVGLPNLSVAGQPQVGAVDERLRIGGGQVLTEQQLGLAQPGQVAQARFGSAMLSTDLNNDGYDDLIVGAPGTPGSGRVGRVDVFFGSASGIAAAGALTLPSPALAGDEFGAALSISLRADDSSTSDLWVGAPDHDVSGRTDAGAIYRYVIGPTGTPSYLQTITQDSPLVPGVAETGDHFGAVLAGYAVNGTVVGVPDEDLGTLKDAGTVERLRTDATTDTLITATDWNQNTAGVPGTAEAGDRFGAAITPNGSVVGVPGEDVGKVKDAGAVQTFGYSRSPADSLVPSVAYNQNSKGVPGTAEAGDRFGAAISDGVFQCTETQSAAIGAPGEDLGKIKDAGSVTLLLEPAYSGLKLSECPAQALSQGSGLPGAAEAGDQVGAAMGDLPGDPDLEEDRMDRVLTGVPGEDIGAIQNPGRVIAGFGKSAQSYGHQGGDVAGLGYGSVFTTWWHVYR